MHEPAPTLAPEVDQQLGGGDEQHAVAGEHRLVSEILGDHHFAQALRSCDTPRRFRAQL
jgi:hypothetical protein